MDNGASGANGVHVAPPVVRQSPDPANATPHYRSMVVTTAQATTGMSHGATIKESAQVSWT